MAKKKATPAPAPVQDANLAGLQAACRNGDETALLIWADVLEEAGDPEAGGLLRRLPHARREIAAQVENWCVHYPGRGEIGLHLSPDGDEEAAYWFCGDSERGTGGPMAVVGPLLARWDEFHPALEWLARGLGLPFVRRHSQETKGRRRGMRRTFRLASGDHFEPLPAEHSFCSLYCDQYDGVATDGV